MTSVTHIYLLLEEFQVSVSDPVRGQRRGGLMTAVVCCSLQESEQTSGLKQLDVDRQSSVWTTHAKASVSAKGQSGLL